MEIRKRKKGDTKRALITAVQKLNALLTDQKEEEAVECLTDAVQKLEKSEPGTEGFTKAIDLIVEAFEGEHELMAYTFHRDVDEWTVAEELAQASSRVISLAKTFRS